MATGTFLHAKYTVELKNIYIIFFFFGDAWLREVDLKFWDLVQGNAVRVYLPLLKLLKLQWSVSWQVD